jgi:hypothetical protein
VTEGTSRTPTVFVSDASAEAVRISDTLRTAGYSVVDVPLSMLISRASVQKPNVVLLDVDATGALDEVVKLRRQPGSGAVDFVYIGTGEGKIRDADAALANEGSAFFKRPVDVGALVRRVEALTGGPASSARPDFRPSTPPPSIPPPKKETPSVIPADRASGASLPAPGLRTPGPPLPMSTPSLVDLVDPPRSLATFGTVSSELQQLLAEAELRADVSSSPEAPLPSPEEEIEAVLPADVLASLDEPLDADEDEDAGEGGARVTGAGTGAGVDRDANTGAHAKGTTSGGSRQSTTGSGRSATPHQTQERRGSDAPRTGPTGVEGTSRVESRRSNAPPGYDTPGPAPVSIGQRADGPSSYVPAMTPMPPMSVDVRGPSVKPSPSSDALVLVAPGDARKFLADAITRRATGAVAFEHEGVVRRIVVREGDFVAAASGGELETLVHFLGARGELPRDEVERLAGKIPPYGRHAGAALVAHGFLRQDQLWNVLRWHAEWIAGAILRLPAGTAQLEAEPPGRLRSEPSVFGASTGCEIFVELVRRAVAPDEAIDRLGGESGRIGDGPNQGLLAECSLPPQDLDLLSRARGGTIRDLLARAPDAEIASVLHALALLGVVDVVPAPDFVKARDRGVAPAADEADVALLDEEAIRARVRARAELVDEGDYFAVLGVARDATSYEIRRAFVELRRTFEPSRILTPRVADLTEDVRKIVSVLEEAYEILRDGARRERYRRAIEARPE